jgi:hypothetical protein
MATVRVLLVLLLLANALFFAWTRGWLAPGFAPPHAGEREPERLAAQIRPEAVVVLPGTAGSAAISAARAAALACMEAGPLLDADVAAAEAALAAAQLPEGSWQREAAAVPPLWLVFAGRAADPASLRTRAEDLKKLNLEFEIIDAPADLANGFVLSRHVGKPEADAALAVAAAAGLRGGRVLQLPVPVPQFFLRAQRVDSDQQDKLKALPPEHLAGGFRVCGVAAPATAASAASAPTVASTAVATAATAASTAASTAATATAAGSAPASAASR